jgi:hypothetical protein
MTTETVKSIIDNASPSEETVKLLTALADYWEGRAAVHDEVAARWDNSRAGKEQRLMDSGLAGGYRGVSDDLRSAIESLETR